MKKINIKESTVAILILVAALSRILPHPMNFAPITAIALFGNAYFSQKYLAFLVPIIAMLISDTWLQFSTGFGFHDGTWLVYLTFGLITVMGFYTLRKVSFSSVLSSTVLGSVIFYLVTNFAFFYSTTRYPHNLAGVISSYTLAIPFFQNSLAGDLVYSGLLFGSFYFISQKFKTFQKA